MLTRSGTPGLLRAAESIGVIFVPLLFALVRVLQVLELLLALLLLQFGGICGTF